jgi:hypothetical protein
MFFLMRHFLCLFLPWGTFQIQDENGESGRRKVSKIERVSVMDEGIEDKNCGMWWHKFSLLEEYQGLYQSQYLAGLYWAFTRMATFVHILQATNNDNIIIITIV